MTAADTSKPFHLWAFGDAHVGTDKQFGRSSLAEAISQSEFGGAEGSPSFDWDIAIDVGDMSGAHHSLPDDAEGEEVRKQFAALRTHRREDVYSVSGNHDRSGLSESEAWWWRKWIDPLGGTRRILGRQCRRTPVRRRGHLGALFVPGRKPVVPDDERSQ